MSLSANVLTKYHKEIVLQGGDYDRFTDDTKLTTAAVNKILTNPWTRVVSLKTVVTLVVEPDPNLNEDFWLNVALEKYNYLTLREKIINFFTGDILG